MNESAALLELQTTDVEIMRATKRLEDLPEKKAILEARAKQREIANMQAKASMLVRKLESELKARQDEIATLTEKLGEEQAKVMATADHRQVQAITREMDGLRRRVDKLEMESLQYMERIDKAKAQVDTIAEALQTIADKESELIEHYKAVGGQIQGEISQLEARRKSIEAHVSADLLSRYEAARANKGGIGVGKLENDTCTACRMSLPAQRVKALHEGEDVGVCPECRRLIVVRTGDEE